MAIDFVKHPYEVRPEELELCLLLSFNPLATVVIEPVSYYSYVIVVFVAL